METKEKGQIFNCHSKNWPQYHASLSVHLEKYIININDSKASLPMMLQALTERGEAGRGWGKGFSERNNSVLVSNGNAWGCNSGSTVIVSFAFCYFDFAGPRFERTTAMLFITSLVPNFVYTSLVLNGSGSVRDHISDLRLHGIDLTSNVPLLFHPRTRNILVQNYVVSSNISLSFSSSSKTIWMNSR